MSELSAALLVRHGLVTADQVAQAHSLRRKEGGTLDECLVRLGFVDEDRLVEFYHKRLMIPRIADDRLLIVAPSVLRLVPPDMAMEFRLLPIDIEADGALTLAMADPSDNHAVDEVSFFTRRYVLRAVARASAVRAAISSHYQLQVKVPSGPPPIPPPVPRKLPPPPPKEEEVVLLTKVKYSEETPLPRPMPPPVDPPEAPEEPILLTRPKRRRTDTLKGVTVGPPAAPIAELRAAADRDEVAGLVLDYVAAFCERALFFVIKRQLLVGYMAHGENVDPDAVGALAINLEAPSLLRDVVASRLPFRGPLPGGPVHRALAQVLGGVSGEVVLWPIAVRDRVIALLYTDRPHQPLPDAALHAVTREAGLAYERLILERKNAR